MSRFPFCDAAEEMKQALIRLDPFGRNGLSEEDQAVLLRAFEEIDWKGLGNFGRNRQGLIRAIRDTLSGPFVKGIFTEADFEMHEFY